MAVGSLSLSEVGSYRRPSAASKLEGVHSCCGLGVFAVFAAVGTRRPGGHAEAYLYCTLIVFRSQLERWRMSFSENRSPFFRDMR
jgi:hypothetical protein